jgi:hypothetical protein
MRTIGTSAFGLRAPIFKQGDDVATIVTDIVLNSGIEIKDKDIIAITEAVMGRTQGNYATVDEIAASIKQLTNNAKSIAVVFPIFSRNRFAILLRGIARSADKITVLLSTPTDEVGNVCKNHPFTGMNYDEYYKSVIEEEGKIAEIYIDNDINVLKDKNIDAFIAADIHTKDETKSKLQSIFNNVIDLTDILHDKSEYGLLGSNKATEEKVKLFPTAAYCVPIINTIQKNIFEKTGKQVEVMVYGDGCFKDPVGGIWEFADPVVSPAFTKGLEGTPNELKLKYLADNKFKDLSGEELQNAIKNDIIEKDASLKGNMVSQGTTPRRITDLLGSLCDLVSGSGDKGTPIVYIQGYFDNFATE